jgi:hypothetical protein
MTVRSSQGSTEGWKVLLTKTSETHRARDMALSEWHHIGVVFENAQGKRASGSGSSSAPIPVCSAYKTSYYDPCAALDGDLVRNRGGGMLTYFYNSRESDGHVA